MRRGSVERAAWMVIAVLAANVGCAGEDEIPAGTEQAQTPITDSVGVAGEWRDLATRDDQSASVLPVPFRAISSELRVITRMGGTSSPYSPGRVIANILSEESSMPVASVRAEQNPPDSIIVDTTNVTAGPGRLELYIAEHRGLKDWQVTVQERRGPS